jgi:hypothetical protein
MLTIRDQQMNSMAETSTGGRMIAPCPLTKTWIEIALIDDDGNPVPGVRYNIKLPDASIQEGILDNEGKSRVEAIIPGQCMVSFPEIHGGEWQ